MIFPIGQVALNQLRRDYKLFEHNGRACFQCRKCSVLFVLTPVNLTPGNFEGLSLHAATCWGEHDRGPLPARVQPFGSGPHER